MSTTDDSTSHGTRMSSVGREQYGSPTPGRVRVIERDVPTPGPTEALVRLRATSLNTIDLDQLIGRPWSTRLATGLRQPRSAALGVDVAGEVVAVGGDVDRLAPGARVWGDLAGRTAGAFAEYVCADERVLREMPSGLPFRDAATIPHSAVLALQALEGRGPVRPGSSVLVNGGGGQVGPWAIQLAVAAGAVVTGVDEADKHTLMREAGAAHVLDHRSVDVTRAGVRYDLVVDIAAARGPGAFRRVLVPDGAYVHVARSVVGFLRTVAVGGVLTAVTDVRMGIFPWVPSRADDLDRIGAMLLDGRIRPLVDSVCSLDDVPAQLARLHRGEVRGKVVVTL